MPHGFNIVLKNSKAGLLKKILTLNRVFMKQVIVIWLSTTFILNNLDVKSAKFLALLFLRKIWALYYADSFFTLVLSL